MAYTFALVSAVVGLGRNDYRIEGERARLRLMEKGDQKKLVWLHREAEEYLDAYIAAAGIDDPKAPLFRTRRRGFPGCLAARSCWWIPIWRKWTAQHR